MQSEVLGFEPSPEPIMMQSNILFFSGHHHPKKLVKQGSFKKISKETLLKEVKEHLARHRLKEKLFNKETSKEKQAFISKTYKLKLKFKEPTTNDSFTRKKLPVKVTLQSPKQSPLATRHFRIERARHATLAKLPIDGPRDSDEVVDNEDAFSRDKLKHKMLLGIITTKVDPDSDSDKPITNDSDDHEKEGVPGHVREFEGGDRVSDEEEKHEEDKHDKDTGSENVHKEEHGIPLPPDDDNDEDADNDEDEDKNVEDEDGRKSGHSSEDEERPSHSLKKLAEDKNHKITPYEISDVMSQELMRIYGGNDDQTAAMFDRQRHLEALNRLRAFSARIRQKMLQRLRFGYPNTIGQNAVLLPQFYVPQTLGIPRVPVRTSFFVSPTASIYRPSYMGPSRSTNSLSQSSNQGYTINVDGLHGVFSKAPGYVVKFHSPDSEVTVVKKERVVNPMTTTHELQIDAK